MRDQLIQMIEEADNLPPLPDIVLQIDKKLNDPKSVLAEIAKLIETEAVLAGRILKVANSAFYGGGRKEVESLQIAVVRLGVDEVRKLIYSLSLARLFQTAIIDHRQFWKHSLAVALFTQKLAEFSGKPTTQEINDAYISGLMHDVGVMVFASLIPDEYDKFLKKAHDAMQPLDQQEADNFGIDHAELGELFIRRWWKVDERVINGVRWHHYPFKGDGTDLNISQLVHVGNAICNNQGIVNGTDIYTEIFHDGAWGNLELSLEDTDRILEDVKDSVANAESLLIS